MGAPISQEVNPLTSVDLDKINQGLAHAEKAKQQAILAERAGLDVSQHMQQIDATIAQLKNIKQTYFPTAQ